MNNTAEKYDEVADCGLGQLFDLCRDNPVLIERKDQVLVLSLQAMRRLDSRIYSSFHEQLDKLRNNFVIGYRD